MCKNCIVVAPKGYKGGAEARFVCSGEHDELIIQKAIDEAVSSNSNILLLTEFIA